MPQLAIAKEFLAEYTRLEKPVQRAVQKAIGRFTEATHTGLHLEKVQGAADPRIHTIRINQFWRGVVLAPKNGDVFCLLRVLPHDDAYAYATTRLFTVNQVLGVLEIRNEQQLQTMTGTLRMAADANPARLFDHVKDAELRSLGVDDQVLPIVRLLTREAHLDAMQHMLPALQYDVLVALAAGMTVEETWAEVAKNLVDAARPDHVEPGDLSAAIERTPADIAFVEGPDELTKMLQPPFALWRIFLHPSQRRIAYRPSYPGSMMVTGGAGTGKTVTALHRAAHLARRYDEGRPILMTTFSWPLSRELSRQLDQLVEDPAARARIEVLTTDQVAARVLRDHLGRKPQVIRRHELVPMAGSLHPDHTGEFIVDEWEQVLLAQDIGALDQYLTVRRSGRIERLPREARPAVWQTIQTLRERLRELDRWSFLQLADEAARVLAADGTPPYRHIVVDEAQDLHPAQWRLLRAAAPAGADDLFLVGDPHQRIRQHRVSMKDTGVRIVGRSQHLTVSYRTTQEILTWAVKLLGLTPADELDGWPDSLEGYDSPMHGRRPVIRRFDSWREEKAAVIAQVKTWLTDGVEPGAIAVTARVQARLDELADGLSGLGVQSAAPGASGDLIQVGSMHSLKGLEYRCVAVVGVQDGLVPLPEAVVPSETDKPAHMESLQRERSLLFVACTRARDRLYVSHSGAPSPFLPR